LVRFKSYPNKKRKLLSFIGLKKIIREIELKKQLLLIDYNITIDILEVYKTNLPSFEKYIDLSKELEEMKR